MNIKTIMFFTISLTLLYGCVAKSTYIEKTEEAAHLQSSLKTLESDYNDLLNKQREFAERNEALNTTLTETLTRNTDLAQDLQRSRADIERVEKVLSARSEETAKALTEMRQTIDRLENDNRTLESNLEKEKNIRKEHITQMKSTYDELVEKMEDEISRGEITISDLQGKLSVNLVESILFDSGESDLKPAGIEVLKRVGNILKNVTDKEVRVEGHTDNVPISSRLQDRYLSNWELSSARAASVVHYLQDKTGIPGERLAICGFGEFRPTVSNKTATGRTQNRRIQIVLVPIDRTATTPLD